MTRLAEPRPRSLFCIIADAHCSLDMARSVCAGRFHEAGQTVSMTLPPDWLHADLPDDDEWRIAWHKFYYGLDLGHAFACTGDLEFLRVWQRLVLSFIEQTPATWEKDVHVVSRRVLNWLYAWNRFAAADGFPGLGAADAHRILDYLGAQLTHIKDNLTPRRNHRTIELTALFHAVLAFPVLDPDNAMRAFAIRELHANLEKDFLPDGVHVERSTHYHMMSLRNFLATRMNAHRFDVALPAGFDDRLIKACEFALHCHRPDGGIPAFSDADAGSYLDLLGLAADIFQREDFRHVAGSSSLTGVATATMNASFATGGYFFQRGASANARYLMWDCGPLGEGGHGHYDMLSVEIAADKPLIIDPGRYTYTEAPPNWRRWFKGTSAHNTVCVDGLDQTPYNCWDIAYWVPRRARAEYCGRWGVVGLDMLCGRVHSPCYDAVHTRRILFVADTYWLIEDRLEAESVHAYDLRFHLTPDAHEQTAVSRVGDSYEVMSPGLSLISLGADDTVVEDGWYAPSYGVKHRAPVVSIRRRGQQAAFITVIAPRRDGEPAPRVEVRRVDQADPAGHVRHVVIEWQGPDGHVCDHIAWATDTAELALGSLDVHGLAAWSRAGATPTTLTWNSRRA